ncbi:hypothetical protein E2C01_004242 [Portunus trituberculatus]|uniref:Uncharacterized protein n=1 Tax=Portunus trituberculatus TaxID=210409 RepID=A0A5B7CQW3_PORTR|nr:hypothetical protein [Portunus trituberculatus]
MDHEGMVKWEPKDLVFEVVEPIKGKLKPSPGVGLPGVATEKLYGWDWRGVNSGSDINSSTEREPELSRSSFRNRFPRRRISSASTVGSAESRTPRLVNYVVMILMRAATWHVMRRDMQ